MTGRADVERVLREHPLLNFGGYGLDRGWAPQVTDRGQLLADWRAELLTPDSVETIARVTRWAQTLTKIKTTNPRHSSYGLKHMAENRADLGTGYVGNGQMITAMLLAGFEMDKHGGSVNPLFNVSERSLAGKGQVTPALASDRGA
jgi:hypothetical protein